MLPMRICILFLAIAPCVVFPALIPAGDTTQRIDCSRSTPDLDDHPRSPFLPNSTSEPTVLDSDPLSLRKLWDEPLCPQFSEIIDTIQLRKYKSWLPDWRHEFVVIPFTCQGENYFMRLDRSWEGTGWEEWIPLPTLGSTKPAMNEVTIHYGKDPFADNTTEVIGQLDFHCGLSFKDISGPLSHVLLNAGSYSLFGMNCWSWSRYLFSSIAKSTRDFVLAVHQTSDVLESQFRPRKFPPRGRSDPWLEYGNHKFENGARPSIRDRIPGTAFNKISEEPELSLALQVYGDDNITSWTIYSQDPEGQKTSLIPDEAQIPPPVIVNFLSQPLDRPGRHRSIIRLDYIKRTGNNHACDTFVTAAITRPYSETQADYLATSFHKIPSYVRKTTMILFSGHPFLENHGPHDKISVWVGCWLEHQRPLFLVDGRIAGEIRTISSGSLESLRALPPPIPEGMRNPDEIPSWANQVPALPATASPKVRSRLPEEDSVGCFSCPEHWISYGWDR